MSRRCVKTAQAGKDLLTAVQFTQSLALNEATAYLTRFLDWLFFFNNNFTPSQNPMFQKIIYKDIT